MTPDLSIEQISEGALLLRFGNAINTAANARVHTATQALREAALPGVIDIAPAYASVLVRFEMVSGTNFLIDALRNIIERDNTAAEIVHDTISRCIEIPVCYGGDAGPDLEAVAAHAGLSLDATIARHTEAEYTVAMLGFAPGFSYLLGLDPALHAPRRADPRTRVPAGSVAIGGAQTGIYPGELPGGWNLIGRTPLRLFDPQRDPPTLVAPGDRVRFRRITKHEFTRLRDQSGQSSLDPRDQAKLRKKSGHGRPFLNHAISDDRKDSSVEVIKPGLLTTLQDAGRPGYAHLGVGRAGAFDAPALRIANALCGNPRGACGLEITLLGPTLRFRVDTLIAVTGAPLPLSIDGDEAPMWAPVFVRAGATVALGAMREGCRSYIAIRSGIAVDSVLGSRSMDVNAGVGPLEGRPLRAGDLLPLEVGSGSFFSGNSRTRDNANKIEPDSISPKWQIDPRPWFRDAYAEPLRLLPGGHFDALQEQSRKLLFSGIFEVSHESNRVGVRLTGPSLELQSPIEMVSEGCVPGLLQLPPSGQPIAFGVECPVSGGYPRIGQFAEVDLPRLAQCRPGDTLRFKPCGLVEALQVLRERERALARLEASIAARLRELI